MPNQEITVLKNYGKKPTFASFLPGISGTQGIPLWCFYVNRGQGVTSFGSEDKNHSIMEFSPAHQAYQNVKRKGFRTFIKCNDAIYEPFSNENVEHAMQIDMNTFHIEEHNEQHGLRTKVDYFILPQERLGALVRVVTITNTSANTVDLTVLDGMGELIPYGVSLDTMKEMVQTAKAWMQVEDVANRTPYYRVRVSMGDTADVSEINGGNFAVAFDANGAKLPVFVDPKAVFGYDTALDYPYAMQEHDFEAFLNVHQNTQNELPCAFFAKQASLASMEQIVLYELYGQVSHKAMYETFLTQSFEANWFTQKMEVSKALTQELCAVIETQTANPTFDAYCKQTYLDNVLRGGVPMLMGQINPRIFYLYSRKHGDIERDYNFFKMLPEFFSQGNGNFRDVNQNRRSDVFFQPYVQEANIKTFYNLIQIDGYNPLVIDKQSYFVPQANRASLMSLVDVTHQEALASMLSKEWTPGQLALLLHDCDLSEAQVREALHRVMDEAANDQKALFGEGYWSDHWTYNLDLIERYLEIYPEAQSQLLFEDDSYVWFGSHATILPRAKRYVETKNGLRQYLFLEEHEDAAPWLCDAQGNQVTSTLMEKLVAMCTLKYAALDAYAMGVEFEGGKPGWYDALNGLPGLFGSSIAESCELSRMLAFVIRQLKTRPTTLSLHEEMHDLMNSLQPIIATFEQTSFTATSGLAHWNGINDAKESYRARTAHTITGNKVPMDAPALLAVLEAMQRVVDAGIERAMSYTNGICPTYFAYEVNEYEVTKEGINAKAFTPIVMPLFLEGPVHWMKLGRSEHEKRAMYERIKQSDLYDTKLKMYKVNASLQKASFEIGRAKAFTPGWLENESIWLHMEYKYLLELQKAGLMDEFAQDFHNAAVPFLNPEVYGRSVLENSSFIASSANPNESIHGRGFVARLSGSTAEFLDIWTRMMFGANPFTMVGEELVCTLQPSLPAYLMQAQVSTTFLGKIKVVYNFANVQDKQHPRVVSYALKDQNQAITTLAADALRGVYAHNLRNLHYVEVEVEFA